MPIWTEAAGLSLLTGASDPNGDPLRIRRIEGAVVTTWPARVPLAKGAAIVTEAGAVSWDDTGATAIRAGVATLGGSFQYTIWDGAAESAALTATISLVGVNSPPVGKDVVLTFHVAARP